MNIGEFILYRYILVNLIYILIKLEKCLLIDLLIVIIIIMLLLC